MSRRDVIICGGGIIGCSISYYLKKLEPSVNVTVIECDSIAAQASGKAGGFLALDWNDDDDAMSELSRLSYTLHQKLEEELVVDVGYRRLATFNVHKGQKDADEGGSERGDQLDWIRDGFSASSMGTKESTSQVHPYLLTNALMNSAKAKGAEVLIGEVKDIIIDDRDRVQGVKLRSGGVVNASAVVLSLGPWTLAAGAWFKKAEHLFNFHDSRVHSIVLKARVPAQAVFLNYLDEREGRGEYIDQEIYPRPDETVYSCGCGDNEELPSRPSDVEPNRASCAKLREMLGNVAPQLREAELVASQACYLPWSADSKPVLGKIPFYSGAFVASGHGCWGILNGPATGLVMASILLDKNPPIENVEAFSIDRFR